MKLLVLAGGAGSRLKSAVADRPKALAPVAGVPFLLLQLQNWRAQGLKDFLFLLHHQADQIISTLEDLKGQSWLQDCSVEWVVEPRPLGTGGAVAFALRQASVKSSFLLTNADTWLGSGIATLSRSAVPSLAVLQLHDTGRYGRVSFDPQGEVTAFAEKSPEAGSGWINAGLCHLSPVLFEGWDCNPLSLERGLFQDLVRARQMLATPLETDFIDIGIPEDYYRFCRWVEGGRRKALCS